MEPITHSHVEILGERITPGWDNYPPRWAMGVLGERPELRTWIKMQPFQKTKENGGVFGNVLWWGDMYTTVLYEVGERMKNLDKETQHGGVWAQLYLMGGNVHSTSIMLISLEAQIIQPPVSVLYLCKWGWFHYVCEGGGKWSGGKLDNNQYVLKKKKFTCYDWSLLGTIWMWTKTCFVLCANL